MPNTDFGFKTVDKDAKEGLVRSVFSSVATKYDMMNNVMSLGLHHLWKDRMLQYLQNTNGSLLDVACGTGDIAFRFYKKCKSKNAAPQITASDINESMLTLCRDQAIDSGIVSGVDYINCNAENLPFADNSFDYYTIAFGIRNVTNVDIALKEAYRVLKPMGKFVCMEFAHVDNALLAKIYDLYSFKIIPSIGKYIAGDEESYQYLVESIRKFPPQKKFKEMMSVAGFSNISSEDLSFGVTAIYVGYKI